MVFDLEKTDYRFTSEEIAYMVTLLRSGASDCCKSGAEAAELGLDEVAASYYRFMRGYSDLADSLLPRLRILDAVAF